MSKAIRLLLFSTWFIVAMSLAMAPATILFICGAVYSWLFFIPCIPATGMMFTFMMLLVNWGDRKLGGMKLVDEIMDYGKE